MSAAGPTSQLVSINPKEAVVLGGQSLTTFGRVFLPKTFRQESPECHEEIGQALYSNSRYNMFQMWRGGAKTTLLRAYTLQRIVYGISRMIMFVSVSQGHSILSIRWLKKQVTFNPLLRVFGVEKGKKWTDEWIEIEHIPTGVTITVFAMGISGQIRGFNPDDYRPDLIIIDDVLDEENTATVEQRNKIEGLLFGGLINSLAPQEEAPLAKAVMLQTPLDKNDASQKALADPSWNGLTISVFDDKGESRWPQRWTTDQLKEAKESHIRRSQYRLWMREWECKIVAGEDKAIDVSKFQYYDLLPDGMDKILAIDPASSDSKKADDFALVVLGFKGAEIYVLDYFLAKGVMPELAATRFFELVLMHQPIRRAVVEKVGYQRVLKWYLEQEMLKRRIFVVMDGVDDRRKKSDRIMQAIPAAVHYGHFHIRTSMTELITQFDEYDPMVKEQKDDLLDAVAMGVTAMNPALRSRGITIEGEYAADSENDYPALTFGGCP